ncbi:MAG: beta-lactamase family protein, partial [bacterium]|nr:beta-lactamase family protein [bacterium]
DALESVVRDISGSELERRPGGLYGPSRYSNANFDIAGAIIEVASGMKYEDYMAKNVFAPLGMVESSIGTRVESGTKSTGYKISFGEAEKFESPVFRGNFPAGYVMSSANDMARFLKLKLELEKTNWQSLLKRSHTPDDLNFYWMGWFVPISNRGIIRHPGLNPNFTASVSFRPIDKTAVAVLANSNSSGTGYLGTRIMQVITGTLAGEDLNKEYVYDGGLDNIFSVASKGLGALIFICIGIILYILIYTIRGVWHFKRLNLKKSGQVIFSLVGTAPLLIGIYLVPGALMGFSW